MELTILVVANPDAPHLKNLLRLPAGVQHHVSGDVQELRTLAPLADVILNAQFKSEILTGWLPYATKARWMHSLFAGVEGVLVPDVMASPLPLSNGKGVFRVPLGEWTVAAMLHFGYSVRRLIQQQEARKWQIFDTEPLRGTTLGIVGYGGIGSEAARLAKPFGVKIVALRRRQELASADAVADRFYAMEELNELMAVSDYVLVSAPLTKQTRGMIGAEQIAAMKPTAVIINVGRGPVIQEAALISALQQNKIRGAALDVFEVEPLPDDHPFWGMQNLLLSPHSADHVANFMDLAYDAFFENLDRFRAGQPLGNLVDKHAGY